MPRPKRIDWSGALHHTMIRGIDGRAIFHTDFDRVDFVERLSRLLPDAGMRCFGWALMTNHVHLLVQTGAVPLARVMQRLNGGFARGFNRRAERKGYLLQDRYKSRLVLDDADLMGVLRYVLRNPLGGGLVGSLRALEGYRWCGYGALLGRRPIHPFEAVGDSLLVFSEDPAEARAQLRSWMQTADDRPPDLVLAGADTSPLLPVPNGSRHEERPSPPDDRPVNLDRLVASVCQRLGILPADLFGHSRKRELSRARAAIAFLALRAGTPGVSVARTLGINSSSVSLAVERGRRIAEAENLDELVEGDQAQEDREPA